MRTNILAPVKVSENSIQFYLNGRVFELVENKINEAENIVDVTFANAIKAFETFEFNENQVKWYHGTSRFVYSLAENKFTWGNTEILSESFANHIMSAGAIRYENLKTAELFQSIPAMLENFTLLDFAATFEGNGVTVDLMKTEDSIFVSRFNSNNRIYKFFEAKNANEALEYVKEQTGEDASLFLAGLLEGEAAEIAATNEQISEFESMIEFLKDQREVIAGHDKSIAEIKAADDLIAAEIKVWESKIVELKA